MTETWSCSCGAEGSAETAYDADFDMDAHMLLAHGATKKTGHRKDAA